MFRFLVLLFHLITMYCVCMRLQLLKERTELMNRYILHQNVSRCNDVKLGFYDTCQIYDKDDDQVIKGECAFENQQCLDGSYNQTCMILYINGDGSKSYTCCCHDLKKPQLSSVEYHWSVWYILSDSRVGLYRELKDEKAADRPVLIKEYRWV